MKRMAMIKKNVSKNLDEAFTEFIKYCRVKNLSERTLDYYEECYGIFTQFYSKESDFNSISKSTIDDYILYLRKSTNTNDITINTRLRGLRSFLHYCMELNYVESFKIQLVKAEKKIKETYTDTELQLLLKKPNLKVCSFVEYRDWTIINYLLATGNRANTIVNIKIKNLDFETATIILETTKNRKQQIIPMSQNLSRILLEYLQFRSGEAEEYLFCSTYGNKMTSDSLKHAVRRYNQRRGVMKTSIHLFRHTFAKKWILAGGDIFRLQKVLGHSSLDIVKEYVNMFSEDLQKDFHHFNALDQLSTNNQSIKMKRK